jgi:hypothetical protein
MLDTRQYFNDLYPIIAKRFENKVENGDKLINSLINVVDSDKIDYRIDDMGGFGEIPKYNGTTVTNIDQKRGYTTIITPVERAAKTSVTLKYTKVDQSGEAKKVGTRLGISMRTTIYNDFLRMWQRAYDANYPFADSLAWAAATHRVTSDPTVADTYSNLITNVLGTTGLDAAMKLGSRYVTADGLPTGITYDLVLAAPELRQKCIELLGESNEIGPENIPESAENGHNPYRKLKWFIIGGGNLGFTSKQWALASSETLKETAALVYITRPMVKPMQDTPFTMNYYPYADYELGFAEPKACIFSNPA